MASDDVIELGSSDEETAEPAPKRRKPPPNAMVHIPDKLLSGVTVTPPKTAKSRINPASIIKGALGQAVTVTKVTKTNINPYATNKKLNGNPMKNMIKSATGVKLNLQMPRQSNANVHGLSIANSPKANPYNKVQKNLNKNLPILSKVTNPNIVKLMKPVPGKMPLLAKSTLKNTSLPPGITIKRTTPPSKCTKAKTNVIHVNPPFTLVRMSNVGKNSQAACSGGVYGTSLPSAEVPTVNLDDDEPVTSSFLGPQWYLRPEDQAKKEKSGNDPLDPLAGISSQNETDKDIEIEIPVENPQKTSPEKSLPASEPSSLEKQNNEEPDKTNYIEITIEDSPIKPTKTKKGFKVGAELAITIEDSPIKDKTDKVDPSNSDVEEEDLPKDRNSKKKLEYPKNVKSVEVVEIEFEPLPPEESTSKKNSASSEESEKKQKSLSPPKESASSEKKIDSESKKQKPKRTYECIDIVEIEESPVKPIEEVKINTPKKNKPTKPTYNMTPQIDTIILDDKEKDEYTPIYQSFIKLCLQLENSEDMKKIVEKKIKAYYLQVPKEYTESEIFTDMVTGKILAMKAGPEKMYLYIKDIVDELNLQRKLAKAQPAKEKEEQQKFLYGEESEFDSKRQRQIRKLEKTFKKLHRAIQKLEEQEVDFDDEEDSVYLLTERYKERSVRVHAKLCQLTNTKMPSEARVQIEPRPGQPKGPSKRIEKWINRKVPIGTPLPFPDFHDVLRCVREANQEDNLGWNEADIMEEARDLFVRCGKKLQRRRQENEWRLAASRIPVDKVDPAEDSTELKRKLEENRRVASKKETEVFNKYADRQNLLKLEAVEIGDKEAEESPVESDDEEIVEVNDSLTNTEKRKERLKRLLQEKSKLSDKGNQPDHLSTEGENSQKDATRDSTEAGTNTKDNEEGAKKNPIETDIPDKEPPKSDLTNNKDQKIAAGSDSNSKSKGDGSIVDSDVDELHLLEKLYSDNEYNNSVIGSSDTGSPIAISDTSNDKTSNDDGHTKKPASDVISIENSSYSESEDKKEDSSKDTDAENAKKVVEQPVSVNMELECSVATEVEKTTNETNNEEYNGSLEDILASSDEGDAEPQKGNTGNKTCRNLADNNISISKTNIIKYRDLDDNSEASKPDNSDKNTIIDNSSVEGMEIGSIEINSEDQSRPDNIVKIASVESIDEENTDTIPNTKSPEINEERSPAEITNVDSVETVEDDNVTCVNVNETTNVKSKENSNDGNINKIKISSVQSIAEENPNKTFQKSDTADETTIQGIGEVSIDEILQEAVNTVESIEKGNEDEIYKEAKENNDLEIKEDATIRKSEDTPMNEVQDVTNTTVNTDKCSESTPVKETKENNNSMSEAMEVDSIDQTL